MTSSESSSAEDMSKKASVSFEFLDEIFDVDQIKSEPFVKRLIEISLSKHSIKVEKA
jgi:hypothetical protein